MFSNHGIIPPPLKKHYILFQKETELSLTLKMSKKKINVWKYDLEDRFQAITHRILCG